MKGLPKRAVVLCRVSTEDQADRTPLDTQAEICMEEARRRGYHVTEEDIFKEDGYSGALGIDERPVLHQLWEKYQAGEDAHRNLKAVIMEEKPKSSKLVKF